MSEYCCNDFKYHINFKCDIHKEDFDCPDKIIFKSKKSNDYGILIHDGGSSYIKIKYCPFCGKRLKNE